jgi:hypothetical protein
MTGARRVPSLAQRVGFVSLAAAALGALVACQTEERVVRYKPFLSSIPDAKTATPATGVDAGPEPTAYAGDTRIENPDGTITLISRSALNLMAHIKTTLAKNEQDLFVKQVLSEDTRQDYYNRGLDPHQAFTTLKAAETDINELFGRMPMGERGPNIVFKQIGPKLYVVELTGQAARGLRYVGFQMVLEKGNFRLRWFI